MLKTVLTRLNKLNPKIFLVGVTLIGLCLMVLYMLDYSPLFYLDTWVFAVVLALANVLSVLFPRSGIFLSLGYPVSMCMMLVRGPSSVMWASMMVLIIFVYRLGLERLVYNVAQVAIVISVTDLFIPANHPEIVLLRDLLWVLAGAVAGDMMNIYLISKYVCYRGGRDYREGFREMWTGRLCIARPILYSIGILMTINYQSQGIWAAVFAFLPGVGIFYLFNSRVALEAKNELVKTDRLTQVGNRYALTTWCERELAPVLEKSRGLSVLMVDIDDFKGINDSFGHLAGDAVLQEVTQALKASLRQGDRIFRYGGEEFVVVLPGVNGEVAREVAARICTKVAALDFAELGERQVTVSIGVAAWSEELAAKDNAAVELVRRSDIAMYLAKRGGKNRVCVFG